jgi:hypothetical protein
VPLQNLLRSGGMAPALRCDEDASESRMPPSGEPRPFKHLRVGARYEVAVPFVDYGGCIHPQGEVWTYLNHSFLPYEDGLSLFVLTDAGQEWQIRLQWLPESQAAVIDQLERHVRPVAEPG